MILPLINSLCMFSEEASPRVMGAPLRRALKKGQYVGFAGPNGWSEGAAGDVLESADCD